MIVLIMGIGCMLVAAFFVMQALTTSARQVEAQVARVDQYGAKDPHQHEDTKSFKERVIEPAIERLSRMSMKMSPGSSRASLARKLHAAGVRVRPQTFMAAKSGLSIGLVGLGFLVTLAGNSGGLLFGLLMGAAAFMLPDTYLTMQQRKRKDAMAKQLPDVLDLLTVSVEAGLGFDAAVQKVTEYLDGPLVDELSITLREVQYGESRKQALRNLSERSESSDVGAFARSIIQADELGTSLGRTLRVQAEDLRTTRQLAAEEKAMKAPVKMMFPTVLFILPALFIVILGPAGLNIMEQMANAS